MPNWIDLNDPTGAKLKLANIDIQGKQVLHLFVTNLSYLNPKWARTIREMSFNPAPSRKYLVRRVEAGEKMVASRFQSIFPGAKLTDMPRASYMLGMSKNQAKTEEERATDVDMRGVIRLGRNYEGQEVFDSLSGRFCRQENGDRVVESDGKNPFSFLRLSAPGTPAPTGAEFNAALAQVCSGFVKAMDLGEVQHTEDYDAFRRAVFGLEAGIEADEALSSAIDGALVKYVSAQYDVAIEAYSPMARLYDYLPPYRGKRRGEGAVPAPLNIAAQRLLGDTTNKIVLFPNAFDGAGFAFLPEGTNVRAYRGQDGVIDLSEFSVNKPGVTWLGKYTVASESGANALIFNADPTRDEQGARSDYHDALQCIRSLAPNARAILMFSADEATGSGTVNDESRRFIEALSSRYSLEDIFETAPILSRKSGGTKGLRTISLRNRQALDPDAQRQRVVQWIEHGTPVLSSWDAVKSHVDEAIVRINLKEAQSQSIDLERASANDTYQQPYLAFSKIGEARTMSPANLQASAQSYLTKLESIYGPVDGFLQTQLGMGVKTLGVNFSPEQRDGMAVMISRYLIGRSSLLSDDTGIGKGRQLAGVATWANKFGHKVVFVTDRSNLFSDLARDLKDIGEWDRFRPLVMNADGEITHEASLGAEPEVLAKGESPASMLDIIDRNLTLDELQRNIVFLTYSQISGVESAKALWLKNQISDALVIFDESHVAAGSDSNIASQVAEIAAMSLHVQFASATWAKTHDNMHIYQRAFPQSVAVGTLAETMRKGGDSFSEIFSTMLSAEGALIRREHDLSKLEVEMVIDNQRKDRNEAVSDKVADVLGAAAYVSGEMQQVFIRSNADSVSRLRDARSARASGVKAKLFSASFGSGSVIYQVMKSVQGALNAEHVGDLAVESIAKGMKPVIVSDATGESLVEAMLTEMMAGQAGKERPELIKMPTLRDMLRHVIYKRLATVRVEDVTEKDIAFDDEFERARVQGTDGDPGAGQPLNGLTQTQGAEVIDAVQAPAELTVETGLATQPQSQVITAVASEEAVDLEEAFSTVAPIGAAEELVDDATQSDDVRKRRRKKIFKDVLIADLDDLPEEAKSVYATGLKEIEDKIQAVPDIAVICFDVMAQKLRDAGISVGEISGRKNMLVRDSRATDAAPGEALWRIVPRAKSKKAVKATIRSFNNGGTQVAIINRSAATGVSMHASPRFLDHSRRHLIEHQMPEDPVVRVQLLGRVNRFDQLSSPLITSASTGIYGEVRYLMMQNRKLARLSANVRSSRDNAMSLKSVIDLFNSVGRQAVKSFLQDNALVAKRLGIADEEFEKNPEIVNRLTMHIPLLPVAHQKMVYDELYSRFDEILIRAELDGENPLRPHELDVRAATLTESMFFGNDSQTDEYSSAFDAPVIARRITWKQDRNPLSYVAVKEAAKVNIERLMASGYLVIPNEVSSSTPTAFNGHDGRFIHRTGQPNIQPEMAPELYKKICDVFFGVTRLAHMATEAEAYEISMTKFAGAKRSYARMTWIKDNLRWLVPGTMINSNVRSDGTDLGAGLDSSYSASIITDVKPPALETDFPDPGKWKITVVTSGDDRPQTYTLRSMISAVDADVRLGEVTGDLRCSLWGPGLRRGLFNGAQDVLKTTFDLSFRGRQTHFANVLTGNMYLAAEWAAATKKGQATIYTDESGARHRAVKLSKDLDFIDPALLPVRIADPEIIQRFLLPMALSNHAASDAVGSPTGTVTVLDTSFKSALAFLSNNEGMNRREHRDSIIVIASGQLIGLSCSPKDARRIKGALTHGQNVLRQSRMGVHARSSNDPAHIVVRSYSTKKDQQKLPPAVLAAIRGVTGLAATRDVFNSVEGESETQKETKVAVVVLDVNTPEKAQRALELVCTFSGLEVYAATSDLKAGAREAIRSVLGERRNQIRERQINVRNAVALIGEANLSGGAQSIPTSTNVESHETLDTNTVEEVQG